MASADKFFKATEGSPLKNSFPSTYTLDTSSPCAFTFPSASTSTPGNFFNKSSTVSSTLTLKAFALNAVVSFLIVIGITAVIFTSSSVFDFSNNVMVPIFIGSPFISIVF